jgi:hypothetical protein
VIIPPDDLSAGQFVVVTSGQVAAVVTPFGLEEMEQRHLNGLVLRIAAVSYPFVVAELVGSVPPTRLPMDVRRWEFSRVNLKYVRAMHPDISFAPPPAASDTGVFNQQEIKP